MKLFITLAVVVVLGAGGYYFYRQNQGKASAATTKSRPTTATIEARDIHFEISAAGDIGPADQVSVRPEVNGRIEELPVDIGDEIKKGALLCRLDDKDLQIERSQRMIEIDGARLSLQKSRRTFSRQEGLYASKLISQELYDDARTEFDLATNSLERAQQNLRLVEDRLRKTHIEAPFDCTVLTRPVSLGQTVSGSAGFNSGTEILTIANLNDMIVNAHVNQADVIRLKQGRDVDIQAESVPGVRMKGIVERIAPQAVIKNGIKGFSARILIKDIDPRVRPGMTAVLSIPVSTADNVLSVPLAAVFSENGDRFVFVKTDEKYERRSILIGVTDYAYAEVLKGLSAGEVVSLDQSMNSAGPKASQNPGGGGSPGSGGRRSRAEAGTSGSPGGGGGGGGGRREGGGPSGGSGGSRPRTGGS
ncbi:MAG: rane fusion protein macrolide-specific efflux system [Verrucomicrobiota bacterium]|jgi:HlyD family secretion protein